MGVLNKSHTASQIGHFVQRPVRAASNDCGKSFFEHLVADILFNVPVIMDDDDDGVMIY